MSCNNIELKGLVKMQRGIEVPFHFSQPLPVWGGPSVLWFLEIPLKPLESPRVYQAPGSDVCSAGWRAVVWSQPGGEDSYSEGARRAGSHSATETLCLCMKHSALISRLYWRHTLPVSNLYCWFSLHSCLGPTQSCCFCRSCSFQWRLDAAVTQETAAFSVYVSLNSQILIVAHTLFKTHTHPINPVSGFRGHPLHLSVLVNPTTIYLLQLAKIALHVIEQNPF